MEKTSLPNALSFVTPTPTQDAAARSAPKAATERQVLAGSSELATSGAANTRQDHQPGSFARTDAGNAELFAHLNQYRLRYNHKRKLWLKWREHWWVSDAEGEVRRFATEAARERRRLSTSIQNDDESRREAEWSLQSESKHRIDAGISLAESEPPLSDPGDNWDMNPWFLGVRNGVLDLKTGELRAGRQDDRIAKHTPVRFDSKALCPRWVKFMGEIFDSNLELVRWIQMATGYSLTGDTSEQVLFMLYGQGANGKSTFLNVLRTVVGDYGYNTSFSTLERSGRSSVPHDVAALVGRRLITASETNENERLNEARIKALTGGDTMTARRLYCDEFLFRPVGKFFLAVNHKPVVSDDSEGFWRRVRLIPFVRQFKNDQADKRLEEKLLEEAPGILNWMVQGCLLWQEQGQLGTPPAVKEATETYQREMDHVQDFLDDCCILQMDAETPASALWQSYTEWCSENHSRALSRNELAGRLKARGPDNSRRGAGGRKVWSGIGLISDNGNSVNQ
jgi:putative DNA primase/helicase